VAPDLRGYNLSDKPTGSDAYRLDVLADDVLGVADALGRDRFAVVGHDWGGVLAWHLAARAPDRIARAAILNAPHPAAMGAFVRRHSSQLARSWYRLAEASLAWCDRGEVVHLSRASHWVQHEEPEEVNRLLLGFLAGGPR
jgi:pimeloyl-ACP methyl ester carboxylesterase